MTRVVLLLNALAATAAAIGFVAGKAPHASENALLAHRIAACELGGAFTMVFVALSLSRSPRLVLLPLAFVGANLVVSVYELASTGSAADVGPVIPEALCFVVYAVFVRLSANAGRSGRLT